MAMATTKKQLPFPFHHFTIHQFHLRSHIAILPIFTYRDGRRHEFHFTPSKPFAKTDHSFVHLLFLSFISPSDISPIPANQT